MPGISSRGSGHGPLAICWRELDFYHECDLCGRELQRPFVVTGCNHCFCFAHTVTGCLAGAHPRCAKCGREASMPTGLRELRLPLVRVWTLALGRLKLIGSLWHAAWLVVGWGRGGRVPAAAIFPPSVQHLQVAIELFFPVTPVDIVVRPTTKRGVLLSGMRLRRRGGRAAHSQSQRESDCLFSTRRGWEAMYLRK